MVQALLKMAKEGKHHYTLPRGGGFICDNSVPADKVEVRVEVDVREEVEERGQSFLKEQIKHIKIHKHLKQ